MEQSQRNHTTVSMSHKFSQLSVILFYHVYSKTKAVSDHGMVIKNLIRGDLSKVTFLPPSHLFLTFLDRRKLAFHLVNLFIPSGTSHPLFIIPSVS